MALYEAFSNKNASPTTDCQIAQSKKKKKKKKKNNNNNNNNNNNKTTPETSRSELVPMKVE